MRKEDIASNASCNAVVDLVDVGSTLPSGALELYTDSSTLLTTLSFANPAYMDATAGIAQSYPLSDSTVITDGTASFFAVTNRDSTRLWTGDVVKTGFVGDLHLNQVVLQTDMTVTISSATYEMPA